MSRTGKEHITYIDGIPMTDSGKRKGRPKGVHTAQYTTKEEWIAAGIFTEEDYIKPDGTPRMVGKTGRPMGRRRRHPITVSACEEMGVDVSKLDADIDPSKAEVIKVRVQDTIIPMYDDVLYDILNHNHIHYVFSGGRGSTKSSFIALSIPLIMIDNSLVNTVCFRKVGQTVKNSIFSQIIWAINTLGLEKLFHIPKVPYNPIIYIPTGQKIFFMGMDDPDKVKSITTAHGYIGITWWEELDQFSGEGELRKVLQSTMRGGDKFWDFRSFNPPISINNWANMYVEDVKDNKDTLIVKNTYLDVPVDWLGQPFIDEAEDLKARNEKAYNHEYLGMAVGTGGSIFDNVEDLDMEQLLDIGGEMKPMYKTFDNIFCGIDWGFARDPFRFVRMHYDVRKHELYIFDEYNTIESRNVVIFEDLYDNLKKIDRLELVTADSAEPKSIADFKAYGAYIRGAEKGPESRRYGTKWLQGLRHIYIDKRRCPHTFGEFVRYEYDRDKEGNFISSYPDGDDHGIDATRYATEKFWKRKGR